MNILGLDDLYLTRDQQRLLGGWGDIVEDLRRLCRSLGAPPDACTCGQGSSHLSGTCACCHAPRNDVVPGCPDCDRLLTQLRPAIDMLTVDTMRFFPIVKDLLHAHAPETARAEGASIERHIDEISRTFKRLVVAADEFRAGCRTSHLHVLKEQANDLLVQVNRLDCRLEERQR